MNWKLWLVRAAWRRAWRALNSEPRPEPAVQIPAGAFDSFVEAFDGRVSGCRRDCNCGREFFDNYNRGYDWEPGELERLHANPNATPLPHAVSCIEFEGAAYVWDCDCWKPRARRIVAFLLAHHEQIADFLTEEKNRRQLEAKRFAVVE